MNIPACFVWFFPLLFPSTKITQSFENCFIVNAKGVRKLQSLLVKRLLVNTFWDRNVIKILNLSFRKKCIFRCVCDGVPYMKQNSDVWYRICDIIVKIRQKATQTVNVLVLRDETEVEYSRRDYFGQQTANAYLELIDLYPGFKFEFDYMEFVN